MSDQAQPTDLLPAGTRVLLGGKAKGTVIEALVLYRIEFDDGSISTWPAIHVVPAPQWDPIASEGPGYQQADLPGHVGFVGPDGDRWTWAIQIGDQPQEFGEAPDEAAAKAAVENWQPETP